VHDDDRPFVLVVSDRQERLLAARQTLRAAGILTASGRSMAAAVSLLSQVQVDGCVLIGDPAPGDARELWEALERYRPGCPKIQVCEPPALPLEGWTTCTEADLPAAMAAVVAFVRAGS